MDRWGKFEIAINELELLYKKIVQNYIHHQHWICFGFQISKLFGGLSICSLEAVVGRDGKEYLIEVNDSATTLMGESQEEDRKNIAELVLKEMEVSRYYIDLHCQNYLN